MGKGRPGKELARWAAELSSLREASGGWGENMPGTCTEHKLVADVAALSRGRVLLVKYKDASKYDNQKGWFLPDDFLAHGEHPTEAAKRILNEQAGVTVDSAQLRHVESFGNGAWHLIFHHRADLGANPRLTLGENVAEAKWFPVDGLPERKAVAHGGWAIDVLEEMLSKK